MPGRANDLVDIPDAFWQRPETVAALRERNIRRLFALLGQYTGASQTQIGIACGMSQGRVSRIIARISLVDKLDVFERIADGLDMPASARIALGLAPRAPSLPVSAGKPGQAIPPGNTVPGLGTVRISDLLSLNLGDEQEEQEEDPLRRRTFVGLTGASLISAVLGDGMLSNAPADAEPFAPILTGQSASPGRVRSGGRARPSCRGRSCGQGSGGPPGGCGCP